MMQRAACLLLLVTLAGCQSAQENRPGRPMMVLLPGETTRAQVIAGLGTPQTIRLRGEYTVLTYSFRRAEGSAFGIGNILISFAMGETLAAQDNLDIILGADDKVAKVRSGGYQSVDCPGPWPFGD
jgi:hypothetical protein